MAMFSYDPEKLTAEAKEEIENAPEHMLYFLIQQAGAVRFKTKHDSADGQPWAPSIKESMTVEEEMFHMQAHCIRQLPKFGVERPLEADSDAPTQEYWNWFRGWKNHIEGLPTEEWSKFEAAMNTHEDDYDRVARWYPEFARQHRKSITLERKDRFDTIDIETE